MVVGALDNQSSGAQYHGSRSAGQSVKWSAVSWLSERWTISQVERSIMVAGALDNQSSGAQYHGSRDFLWYHFNNVHSFNRDISYKIYA